MTDLPTLRKHEAALALIRDRGSMVGGLRGYDACEADALGYALSRLREDIARADKRCPSCADWTPPRVYECGHCHGTGKRPTEVT
jgi:hypothetical protein